MYKINDLVEMNNIVNGQFTNKFSGRVYRIKDIDNKNWGVCDALLEEIDGSELFTQQKCLLPITPVQDTKNSNWISYDTLMGLAKIVYADKEIEYMTKERYNELYMAKQPTIEMKPVQLSLFDLSDDKEEGEEDEDEFE